MNYTSDYDYVETVSPEKRIADALRKEIGVDVNPQALRIFIRHNWSVVRKAAHEIHDAK